VEKLLQHLSKAFQLEKSEIVGFSQGQSVYPLSLVGLAKPDVFAGKRMGLLVGFRDDQMVAVQHPSPPAVGFNVNFYLVGGDVVTMSESDMTKLRALCDNFVERDLDFEALGMLMIDYEELAGGDIGDDVYENLVEEHLCSAGENEIVQDLFWRIFHAFDHEGNGSVRTVDLFTGLLFLSPGPAKSKFALLFDFFNDEENDLVIHYSNLLNIIRSILTVTLAISESVCTQPAEYVASRIISTTMEIWESLHEYVGSKKVAFDGFLAWYKSIGKSLMPWCEILGNVSNIEKLLELYQTTPSSPTFRFTLVRGKELVITAAEVTYLEQIARSSGLADIPFEKLLNQFRDFSERKQITKVEFDNCVRVLIPVHRIAREEQQSLSYSFSTFFFAYDRDNVGSVHTDELFSGLSLLCRGNKSNKLGLSFNLFDDEDVGLLTHAHMTRYLRSFLTILFALRKDAPELDADEVYKLIDETAVDATRGIYDWLNKDDRQLVSFEDFGQWYNETGHAQVPWLELLSLSKWPFKDMYSDDLSDASDDEESDEEESDESVDETVFHINLSPDGEEIDIDKLDLNHFRSLFQSAPKSPDEVIQILGECFLKPIVSKDQFLEAIKRILGIESSVKPGLLHLRGEILKCFSLFDTGHGFAPLDELSCAALLLANGNKSDKLALAFSMFDKKKTGRVGPTDMHRFMMSLLLAVFGFTHKVNSMSVSEIRELVEKSVASTLSSMAQPSTSFEIFASWYSKIGHQIVPYLELYDISKWPITFDFSNQHPIFVFRLHTELTLEVFSEDVYHVEFISTTTGLHLLSPDHLQNIIHRHALTVDSRSVIRTGAHSGLLVDLEATTDASKSLLMRMMNAYSDLDHGIILPRKLLCGLLLFTSGKKSDKLDFAFKAFGRDVINIPRAELHSYLVSFIIGILSVTSLHPLTTNTIKHLNEYGIELTAMIFRESIRENSASITFPEFGRWYSEGGYTKAPWIELLEVAKWTQLVGRPAPPVRSLVFKFYLSEGHNEKMVLAFSQNDISMVNRLTALSDFQSFAPSDILSAFENDTMSKTDFDSSIRLLTSHLVLSVEEKVFLSRMLSSMFFAYDRAGMRKVPTTNLLCGLLLLVGGSKSEKLQLAWNLFDPDGNDSYTQEDLQELLASILTGLFVLSEDASVNHSAVEMWTIVDSCINELVTSVYSELDVGDELSFEEFANFYTEGGHELIPWLELLSLKKWRIKEN